MLVEEYKERYYLGYFTGYAWRDHLKGRDLYKILDEIKNMDFLVLKHSWNEIFDLEAKQEEEFDFDGDPAPNAPVESSTITEGN